MRRAMWLMSVCFAALFAVSCSAIGGHSARTSPPPLVPTPTVPPVPGSIDPSVFYRATSWTQNGAPASFVPINFVSLTYVEAEHQLGVTTGCGSIGGTAVFDGTRLLLSNVSRNRTMEDDSFCTDADKHQDDVMAAFFTSSPAYTMTGSSLDFASGGMTLSFVISPDDDTQAVSSYVAQ